MRKDPAGFKCSAPYSREPFSLFETHRMRRKCKTWNSSKPVLVCAFCFSFGKDAYYYYCDKNIHGKQLKLRALNKLSQMKQKNVIYSAVEQTKIWESELLRLQSSPSALTAVVQTHVLLKPEPAAANRNRDQLLVWLQSAHSLVGVDQL